jgi:hypothetical protein
MKFLHTNSTILSNNSTIFPVDKEFHLVYLDWVFKKVMTVLFVAVLAWAVLQAWWGDIRGSTALLFIAGAICWFGKVR